MIKLSAYELETQKEAIITQAFNDEMLKISASQVFPELDWDNLSEEDLEKLAKWYPGKFLAGAAGAAVGAVKRTGKAVVTGAKAVGKGVGSVAKGTGKVIKGGAEAVGKGAVGAGKYMGDKFKDVGAGAKQVAQGVGDVAKGSVKAVGGVAKGAVGITGDAAKAGLNVAKAGANVAKAGGKAVATGAAAAGAAVAKGGKKWGDNLKEDFAKGEAATAGNTAKPVGKEPDNKPVNRQKQLLEIEKNKLKANVTKAGLDGKTGSATIKDGKVTKRDIKGEPENKIGKPSGIGSGTGVSTDDKTGKPSGIGSGTPPAKTPPAEASNAGSGKFGPAFASARKSGKKEFSWNGKQYNTNLA